jgi:hypothetical protein
MALTDENNGGVGTTMLVSPTGNNNGGFGFGGDWSALLIIFLLCMFGGGWGMGGFGGGMMWPMMMGGFGGGFGMDYLYPWLNNSQHISDGFRDQYLNTQIGDLRTDVNRGFGDVQLGLAGVNQNLCQTGNGIVTAVNGAQNAISQQLYSNELASLNRSFAEQTANTAGFTNTAAGIADLRYTVATEACADRAAIGDALKDVIAANTASTQKILDQLCQDKIDAKNDEIARLRQEINMQTLAASQAAQNAFIQQGFSNEVDQLYNRLSNCPVPSTPVYGRTPIFTCNNGGCGCGNGFAN